MKGEARFEFNPGEKPIVGQPAPDGDYQLTLKSKGADGIKGWKSKPKKFPSRRTVWNISGTEDELTGEEKTITEYISLSPKVLKKLGELAFASGYPEQASFNLYSKPTDAGVQEAMAFADAVLDFIEENGVSINARVGSDEFNGENVNRVARWLGADEVAEAPEAEEAEASEDEADEPAEDEDEGDEEEKPAPKKPVKNGVKKHGKK